MALPATDNFNRANGALGSNWTGSVGADLKIKDNYCAGSDSGGQSLMYWSADATDAAQYAQCVISLFTNYLGVTVRTSATDFVEFQTGTTNFEMYWYNSGSWTQIGSTYSATPSNGQTLKLTANGTSYAGFVDGTSRVSGTNTSAPSTGYGGILMMYDEASNRVDDFEVGNLTASGAMIGAATGRGTAAGTSSAAGALSGAGTGTATPSATLLGRVLAIGAATGAASPVGALVGRGVLAGAITGTATQAGALVGRGVLAGAISSTGTALATADTPSGSVVGVGTGTATASGTLAGSGLLAGAITGSGVASATTYSAGALAGHITASATQSGVILGHGALVGDAFGYTTYDATLTGSTAAAGVLIGLADASATASATLTADGVLIGSVIGTGTARLVYGLLYQSGTRTVYKPDQRLEIEADNYGNVFASKRESINSRD